MKTLNDIVDTFVNTTNIDRSNAKNLVADLALDYLNNRDMSGTFSKYKKYFNEDNK
mgnify:CR=1 FL=1